MPQIFKSLAPPGTLMILRCFASFCVSFEVKIVGDSIETVRYFNSIYENFPNPNRNFKIDGTISNRYVRELLPGKANLDGGSSGLEETNYVL